MPVWGSYHERYDMVNHIVYIIITGELGIPAEFAVEALIAINPSW
jgi:hypothetical protein